MATDLEVGVRYEVTGVDVDVPGAAVLPVARFGSDPARKQRRDVPHRGRQRWHHDPRRAERVRLPGRKPARFPAVAEFTEAKYHELSARLLRELIRRTIFATDNESSRYALGGVLLECRTTRSPASAPTAAGWPRWKCRPKASAASPSGDSMTIVPTKAMKLIERALADDAAKFKSPPGRTKCSSRTRAARSTRGWSKAVFPSGATCFRSAPTLGQDRADGRPAFTRRSARRRSSPAKKAAASISRSATARWCSAAERPKSASRASNCRWLTTARQISITLDPRYLSDFLKVLDPEKTFTLELKDGEAPPSAPPTTATAT